ncbi:MAG: GAF domain-containing protein, partial [Burkholderiaceae bacterium]|nr:GAF domain-containing protein [Burkholderiaceae bacterium]
MATREKNKKPRLSAARAARLVAEVWQLTWTGRPEEAIERASAALAAGGLSAAHQAELLDVRAENLLARSEPAHAAEDVRALGALARREGSPALRALAFKREAVTAQLRGEHAQALRTARAACKAAQRGTDERLLAHCQSTLAWAMADTRTDLAQTPALARSALVVFERMGPLALESHAWFVLANVYAELGQSVESSEAAAKALAVARRCGDPAGQARALFVLSWFEADQAKVIDQCQQALAAFAAAGNLQGQATALLNLGSDWMGINLFRQARRTMLLADALNRRAGRRSAVAINLCNLCETELLLGHLDAARDACTEATELLRALDFKRLSGWQSWMLGRIALAEGKAADAVRLLQRACKEQAGNDDGLLMGFLSNSASAHLAAGQPRQALAATRRGTALHQSLGLTRVDGMSPADLWWQHSRALRANGHAAEADAALTRAYGFLVEGNASIGDEGLRRNALNKRAGPRELLAAWVPHAREQSLTQAEREAHLAGKANPREPFERLVDTGLRLNQVKSEAELCEFLIDEVTELSGAERVLLLLDTEAGPAQVAGALLPPGENEAELLRAIAPWLAEARRTRVATLRHGPDGAEAIDQRSCLIVPLMLQRELLGFVYADLGGLYGRLHDGDTHLLSMLATQAALALANVRAAESLERKVVERTAEATAAQAEAEQRAGELALINSIQQGMAAKLDFQGIVHLVGDKLREVFGSEDLSIRWWDDRAHTIESLYSIEHGRHLPRRPPSAIKAGSPVERLLRSGIGATHGSHAEQIAAGISGPMPGTDWCLSIMAAPIRGTQRVLGMIVVENHEREHAYGDADLRLLTTIGATMGTALESARLFDETQRLLKETEARNAELAVINTIHQGVAGSLDFMGIARLVGDKLREVFDTGSVSMMWLDETTNHIRTLYNYEHGKAIPHRSTRSPAAEERMISAIRELRAPLVLNTRAEQVAAGVTPAPGTDWCRSMVAVVIVGSNRGLGMIALQNHEREHAYGAAEVRLLQTVASSMGMALENARLLEETRQSLERQTASADVLQVISGSMADAQPVFEKVLDSCQRLFGTDEMGICLVRDGMIDFAAYRGRFSRMIKEHYPRPLAGSVSERVILSGHAVHIPDAAADGTVPSYVSELVEDVSNFSLVSAPLMWQGQGIGTIDVARSPPRPFGDSEIEQLRTFADQAVIAIQNARMFRETNEALERQTATAEILKVIAGSPGDVQPVFDAIAASSNRLLGGFSTVVMRIVDGTSHLVAFTPTSAEGDALLQASFPMKLADYPFGAAILRCESVRVVDTEALPASAAPLRDLARARGFRGMLLCPLVRERVSIGMISVTRREPGPFADHQLQLLQTFADQAVIAIENVRMFNETQEALERQTATADILQVISASVRDPTPVFEKILVSCERLFGGSQLIVFLVGDDGQLHLAAMRGPDATQVERARKLFPRPLEGTATDLAIREHRMVISADALNDPQVPEGMRRVAAQLGESYSLAVAPMIWEGRAIGSIFVGREKQQILDAKEQALLKTFADQAVIAIQNARLF